MSISCSVVVMLAVGLRLTQRARADEAQVKEDGRTAQQTARFKGERQREREKRRARGNQQLSQR